MSELAITRAALGIKYLQGLDRPEQQYNCTCKEGGQDAMSVDTDWLLFNINAIAEGWDALVRAAAGENS